MSNSFLGVLLFITFTAIFSSLTVANLACGQVGVTTPILPGFSVNYEEHKWYMSPTYDVDPSTGKAVMTHEGYYKYSRGVKVSISNQPFESYYDSEGNHIELFYDVRWKPHGSDSWENLPDNICFTQNADFYLTGIVIGFKGYEGSEGYMALLEYAPGNQIDFQIQASIGYFKADNIFEGKTSGWSDTQTLTIPANDSTSTPSSSPTFTASPSQSPIATPQQPSTPSGVLFDLDWSQIAITLLGVIVAALVFALVLLRRRNAKQSQMLSNASALQ